MSIALNKKRLFGLGAAIAVTVGWSTWLAAVPGPGTGHSFTTLASPFTQDLYATTGNIPSGDVLGGVAFAPDGRVWSADCAFLGTRLHLFKSATTPVNGSSVHEEELVVDLRDPFFGGTYPGGAGGCGLVNHPDGSMYSSSMAGIWQLNATTGQVIAGPFTHAADAFGKRGANALGIAVDPQPGHHLVYVGDDCHPSLDDGEIVTTCTLWDLDPVTHISLVFARLTRAEFMLIDGLYFDPSGNFLFAAHRQTDFDSTGRTDHNSLQIISRPAALKAVDVAVDDTQSLQFVPMVSEPDGVAFHAVDGFVVTLNESRDCVSTTNTIVATDPNTGNCPGTTTPIGGTMTRFNFAGADYKQVPTVSTFATGGFRGDLAQVGPDGCIYATQAPFAGITGLGDITLGSSIVRNLSSTFKLIAGQEVSGLGIPVDTRIVSVDSGSQITLTQPATQPGTEPIQTTQIPLSFGPGAGTRYDDNTETGDNSIVQICGGGGFVLPPGVTPEVTGGSIAGRAYADLDKSHGWNVREPGIVGVTITLTLSGAADRTTTTAGDGTYSFTGLAAGSYSVAAPGTAVGLGLETDSPLSTTLTAGENKTGLDFGYVPGGVSGVAFADLNKSGVWDAAEPGIADVTITLTLSGASAKTTTTAADGSYSFTGLVAGAYSVSSPATAAGLLLYTASPLSANVQAGKYVDNLNFGYVPPISLSCVAATTGQVGVAYTSSLVATGGVGPYVYSISAGSLPAGLTLDAATGAISGTPTATGSSSLSAHVIDAQGTGADSPTGSSCGITIAPAPPALSCVAATTGQVGVAYTSSLVATGGAGAPYTYSIVSGSLPNGLTLDGSTGAITGTPTVAGSPAFTAQVVDARGTAAGTTSNGNCGITIGPAAPTLSCVATTTGQVGVAYSASLTAAGGAGAPYTYSISSGSLPNGLSLNTSSGAITGTPTTAGPFSLTAQVVDSRNTAAGTTTGSSCGITIAPAPPALACVAATTGQVGVAYTSSLVATGGAGAPYTYSISSGSLPNGLTLNGSTGAITGIPTAAGSPSFTAQVVDARGTAAGTTSNSSCGITIAPAPPALSCVAATTGQVGVAYSSSLVATGGVGPYTYSIISGSLPSGLTLNTSSGAITGTPATAGPFSLTAQVVDSRNTAAGTTTGSSCGITIAPAPPALSCVAAITGQVGVAYTSSLVATGGAGAPYTYSIISGSLPSGLTLNTSTGAITGTPATAGPFSLTAQVVDSRNTAAGTTTGSSCGITIAPAPLTIACVSPATGQVGVAYSGSALASGGVLPYTYAIVGTLPAGLTLNTGTGQISGTPAATGSFTVKVTDSNGGGSTATSACSVTIAPAPLTIACLAPATGQVGVPYSGSAVASGGVLPYTYAIVGTLPAGLTLNTGTGQISGTPAATGSFTVKVTDANGAGSTATSACSVTIAPAPLTIACLAPATGQVGVAYSGSAVASGGVLPYTYAIVGTLPAGLTLNTGTGQISGTPAATGSFTVKVTDANGAGSTATSACSVTIVPAPLTIACVSPVTGQVGVPYSGSAVASGGVLPYTYAIVGTLPAGLTLNTGTGQISGTPAAAGSFTVKVTDSNGAGASTATSACSVTIAPAPPALACVAATTGQVGVAYSSSLVATGGVAPYNSYSIMSGSLATGLSLNTSTGAITGTPTAAGSFPFTARVVDSRNSAAGTSTNSSCGITTSPVAPAPGLSITKSANTTTYTSVGQVIVYTYVVKNIGNVTVTGPFTVTDDKLGALQCGTATSLISGASITCSASYVIKATDLGNVISLPSGVPANVDTGAWLQGVLSTQDTTISSAGPGVPNGIYPGWCIQDHVPTDLHNQPATLYSTVGGNLPAALPNPAVWNKVNYVLNHKIRGAGKSDLEFFKDVQTAVWVSVGEQNPEFGVSATAQQMINEANAHPSFVPGPYDVVAVIVFSDGILPLPQIRTGEIQESIIEMAPKASITNLAIAAGKFGTATVTSNQAQATVTQVIQVLTPDVVSLTQSAASAAIASAGLTVGTVTSAPSSIVPSGGVASQTPAAGISVSSGSAVALVISSGAPALGPVVDKTIFSDGTGQRTTAPFSTASPGEALIAFATSDGPSSGNQTLTVAGAGLTWTLVRRANAQLGTAEIWKATAANKLTNVTVSSTQTAAGYHQSLTVVTFTRATGVGASVAAGAATGAPTASLTTTKANSLVFGTGNDWDKALARTVGPNQQIVHEWVDAGSGDTHWVQAGSSLIPTAGTLFRLNDTAPAADHWNLTAVEIVP